MKVTIIGEYWIEDAPQSKRNENYYRLCKDIPRILGEQYSYSDFHGQPPYEVVEVDGSLFKKDAYDREDDEGNYYTRITRSKPHKNGDTLCPCGNMSFHIVVNDYSCYGTCSRCGKKYLLYSG